MKHSEETLETSGEQPVVQKETQPGFTIRVEQASCGHWRASGLGIVGTGIIPSKAIDIWCQNMKTASELFSIKTRMEPPNSKTRECARSRENTQ